MFIVVYIAYDDSEIKSNQEFLTEMIADEFIKSFEWDEDTDTIDDFGWERTYVRKRYYNPEDKDSYFGYRIEENFS